MLALPIFPCSHPQSIFGADELNYRVRNGNGWTLIAINTNYLLSSEEERKQKRIASFFLSIFIALVFWLVTRGRVELPFAA